MRFVLAYAGGDSDVPEGWERHVPLYWRDFEASDGVYRWPEAAINASPQRPCHLEIIISSFNWGQPPVDYTPAQHKVSLTLAGDGTAQRPVGEIPNYADPAWTQAYQKAIAALGARYRDDPRVASFWLALGWNAETCAAGSGYEAAAKPLLAEDAYLRFIDQTTRVALAAWGDKPVYIAGAPSPGNVWGKLDRSVIVAALQAGARYRNCALVPDQDNAFGLGLHAGTLLYDIIPQAKSCAFENGTSPDAAHPLLLYWMLLRALHWRADFVDLYRAWIPLYQRVIGLLPLPDTRWIVFRDQEFPAQRWGAYGLSGEPGYWAHGVVWESAEKPVFAGSSEYGFNRWALKSSGLILRLPFWDTYTPRADVTIWRPNGLREQMRVDVTHEVVTLPAGDYHRVDVIPAPADEQVTETLERRVAALEAGAQEFAALVERLRAALG